MIPRTRPNFTFADLAKAALVGEASGRYKDRLRGQIGTYFGADDVLLTPSGRCGLYAILKAMDRPRVVVPSYTCNAVVEAALLAGKQVVYAEVEEDGFNVQPETLRNLVGPDTVVVATHQFGIPCDIERTVDICRQHGAFVVEDAAASFGTRVRGRLTGTFGDASFFSFDISKLINVPLKGGAVLARDHTTFEKIRLAYKREIERMPVRVKLRFLFLAGVLVAIQSPLAYRLFYQWCLGGDKFTAESPEIDLTRTAYYRYDMTNWQAYIACRQMEHLDKIIHARQAHYTEYRTRLMASRSFALPPADVEREWACIRFPIRVQGDKIVFYRKTARRAVDCAFSFTFIAAPAEYQFAHCLAASVLDIPFYFKLSEKELGQVVQALASADVEFQLEHKQPC